MKRLAVLALCLALPLAAAGCGEKKETTTASPGSAQPLTLMLDWTPNADHVGIYRALSEGDFGRVGLDVHIQTPNDPAVPLQLLAAGRVDAAISYEPEVLLARDRGLPLVSVAAVVQRPLTSIISLQAKKIAAVKDLRGKKVGYAGIAYQRAYLSTILAHAGLPTDAVHEINVGANLVPATLAGSVEATLGGYWNYEAIQLTQKGKHPRVIRVDQVGVPTYNELVLVVRRATIMQHPDLVRRLVQAVARGYESVRSNPAAGVQALLSANPGLDGNLQRASVRATLSSFFPGGGKPWGWQNPVLWNAYGQWMMNHHLISRPEAIQDASTNEVLAGQGP